MYDNNYDLIIIGREHYYRQPLNERTFDLLYCTPYSFKAFDREIYESSWTKLLPAIMELFLEFKPCPNDKLLKFKRDWTVVPLFSSEKRVNHVLLSNGLYMNVNCSSTHSVWNIMALLKFLKISHKVCKLIIHRPCGAEPDSVTHRYSYVVKDQFGFFLKYKKRLDEATVQTIIKNIDFMSKRYLSEISKAYNNLFLFYNYANYCSYSGKLWASLSGNPTIKNNVKKAMEQCLKYLSEFYKGYLK